MAEILPQVSPFTGNKYADWGGPWGAPSTNDLINFGSLLKDNWGTIKSEGPGVIKSYAEDLNPMNYIDLTPVKQFFPRPDRGLEEQPIWNPEKPESEWEMPSLEFDLERTGLPEGQSWFRRAMERLIPAASALEPQPDEPMTIMDIPGIKQYPQVPLPAQPLYPTLTPDTPLRQHRQPHYPKWSLPGELGPQDDFTGVQWLLPEPITPPVISEFDFSTEDFRAPPAPSAPSNIHAGSGVPPQSPQVASDDQEEIVVKERIKAVVPAKVVKANRARAASATKKALNAFAKHEEAKRSGSPAEISRTNRARVQAAIERKEADARNRSTQRYDQFAFEDRRGGRR